MGGSTAESLIIAAIVSGVVGAVGFVSWLSRRVDVLEVASDGITYGKEAWPGSRIAFLR